MQTSIRVLKDFAGRMAVSVILAVLCVRTVAAKASQPSSPAKLAGELWSQSNAIAWLVAPPWDEKARQPEERAAMLRGLGFTAYAYNWREKAIPTFEREIHAIRSAGIDFVGWALYGSENPALPRILQVFKSQKIHPELWLMQTNPFLPKTPEEWGKFLPSGTRMPRTEKETAILSVQAKADIARAQAKVAALDTPRNAEEQEQRLQMEADRLIILHRLVAPYGCTIQLYNHNNWFGREENQLALIARLKGRGVADVGMVYNFDHARDEAHDDSVYFATLWAKMQAYVTTVNITGMPKKPGIIFPSQGDSELAMMRVNQDSGWRGRIGLIGEKGGDAEQTMRRYRQGLDWLAAELRNPGSGGPRPFPPAQ